MKNKHNKLEIALILFLALLLNIGVYTVSRWITSSWQHCDMTTSLDRLIPFVPWTVFIYLGCYAFWGANYFLCAMQDEAGRDRFFCADALSKLLCFALFLLIPTTNVRPAVTGQTIWDTLMRLVYSIDAADNLFPSIHCLVSWLCWIGVRNRRDIPLAYRLFSLAMAAAVCVSTLTTYQHVIADVAGGVLLAEACYLICGHPRIRAVYSAAIRSLRHLLGIRQTP